MINSEEMMKKSFETTEKSMAGFWDTWLLVLGSITWSQEQMDSMVQKYMEQKKVAREEAAKVVEELAQQAKKVQEQFGELAKESIPSAFQNFQASPFGCMDELSRKVDELSKKVDNL